jgi:aromatic-L-amino-acid decarboxylase
MPPIQDDPNRIDISEHGPELSRPFRGLRVWLPLKMHGTGVFEEQLEEKLALAHWAADRVRAMPGIEMLAEPQLSLFAFRLVPPGWEGRSAEELNRLNRAFLERINTRQRVFLTGTMLGGVFALRICVLSFRTHRERIEMAVEDIEAAIGEMASQRP